MAGNVTASDVWNAISGGKRISLAGLAVNETLSGNLTLDESYGNLLRIDPGGAARDVTLPAAYEGAWYLLFNGADAAETITIKNAAGGTVTTCTQDQAVLLMSSGGVWFYFGKLTAPA